MYSIDRNAENMRSPKPKTMGDGKSISTRFIQTRIGCTLWFKPSSIGLLGFFMTLPN